MPTPIASAGAPEPPGEHVRSALVLQHGGAEARHPSIASHTWRGLLHLRVFPYGAVAQNFEELVGRLPRLNKEIARGQRPYVPFGTKDDQGTLDIGV
ncbi:hypothetical protein AB0J28_13620 [Streptosporangium canum]|uniref:hypothetical protein n=1 Tax=Streptosporangium canum TaxID=324952 RepID=UPI00343BA34B